MLKKQTVWLLTMLSLVVVLSVYYVTAPKDMNDSVAFMDEQNKASSEKADASKEGADVAVEEAEAEEGKVTSGISSDDVFTALRLKIEDERSRLRDQLNAIVASSTATPEEKSKAYDQMQKLAALADKEATLETLIKSKGGYEDVLVRADGDTVRVTVKAKQRSAKAANEIIQLVKSEMSDIQDIAVEFQPAS